MNVMWSAKFSKRLTYSDKRIVISLTGKSTSGLCWLMKSSEVQKTKIKLFRKSGATYVRATGVLSHAFRLLRAAQGSAG